MKIKDMLLVCLCSSVLVLLYGAWHVYDIFYASYFDQVGYHIHVFRGGREPTKMEVLFAGFQAGWVMTRAVLAVLTGLYLFRLVKRRRKRRLARYT